MNHYKSHQKQLYLFLLVTFFISSGLQATTIISSNMKNLIIQLRRISVLILLICSASLAQAADDEEITRLMKIAEKEGSVNVIIELDVQTDVAQMFSSPASKTQQLSAISQAQNRVISKLQGTQPDKITTYKHFPTIGAQLTKKELEMLLKDPDILYIYEDIPMEPKLAESGPLIGVQSTFQTYGYTGAGQAIVIIDTGVDNRSPFFNHSVPNSRKGVIPKLETFTEKIVEEACFSRESKCTNGQKTQFGKGAARSSNNDPHGTHVAGIAAGHRGDKPLGFTGVARDASIIAINVHDFYQSDIFSAIDHVVALSGTYNIAAVNMSFGSKHKHYPGICNGANNTTLSYNAKITALVNLGIVSVAASGNSYVKNGMNSPACIGWAFSVGATNDSGPAYQARIPNAKKFSDLVRQEVDDVIPFSNSDQSLDILAPGGGPRADSVGFSKGILSSLPGGLFTSLQGTSMAAPHVAGAVAVLKQARKENGISYSVGTTEVGTIFNELRKTGKPITDTNGITKPRLQLDKAIRKAIAPRDSILETTPKTSEPIIIRGLTGNGQFFPPISVGIENYGLNTLNYEIEFFPTFPDKNWLTTPDLTRFILKTFQKKPLTFNINTNITRDFSAGRHVFQLSLVNTTMGSSERFNNKVVVIYLDLVDPLQNDNLANALEIPSNIISGSEQNSNTNSSSETNESSHTSVGDGHSVWWKWVAPATGEVTFDTCGDSDFNTVIAVYTGSNVSQLTPVASNDNSCGQQSSVTFNAQLGVTYYIAVDGRDGESGTISLNWNFTQTFAPINDDFSNAMWLNLDESLITEVAPVLLEAGTNLYATEETGEPSHTSLGDGNSVWWKWEAPSSGEVTFDTCGGSDFNTVMAVYTGSSVSQLTPVASNDNSCGQQSRVTLNAQSGETYYIAVDGRDGETGSISLNWLFTEVTIPATPANDNFSNAITLSGNIVTDTGSNTGATEESGEPKHNNNDGRGKTVWWKWATPDSGNATVDTFGSNFDTILDIYTGSQLSNLRSIGSSDDAKNQQSKVSFTSVAGQTYFIAVDSDGSSTGNIVLNVVSEGGVITGPPSNVLVANDFNNDNKSDVFWRNAITNENKVYLMNGNTLVSDVNISIFANDPAWGVVGTGDFNNDQKADILWRNTSTGQNHISLMNGTGTPTGVNLDIPTLTDSKWKIAGVGDLDDDSNDDDIFWHHDDGENRVTFMNGTSPGSTVAVNTIADPNWKVAGIADMNGDGNDDILWRNNVNRRVWLYLMNGSTVSNGVGSGEHVAFTSDNWDIEGVGDFDADGKGDILWRHNTNGRVWMYMMNGSTIINGSSEAPGQHVDFSGLDWDIQSIGDYNGDGRQDIFWRNNVDGRNHMYLMNGANPIQAGGTPVNTLLDLNWTVRNQ